jgi:hypothetical protein
VIPSSIGDLKYISWLDLSSNKLTGEIPFSIEKLSLLAHLNLENNMLSGSITSSFGYLSSLGYINLSSNMLSGGIPTSLGYLHFLYHLDLKNNHLNGSIPSSFGDLRKLEYLILDNNYFLSEIPNFLGDISSISHLSLGNNQFSGEIPSSIGDLLSLVYLNLESNQLTGQIPQSFVKLRLLKELYLADNILLAGLFPSLPGVVNLDINGTNLYFTQEGSSTSTASMESIPTEIPDVNMSDKVGVEHPINLLAVVMSSVGALVLAIALGILILIMKRRNDNKKQRDNHNEFEMSEMFQYQISEMSPSKAAETSLPFDSELTFISKISAGAFGVVWKGTHKGKTVAIKKMKLEKMPRGETKFIQLVINEAKIMRDMPENDRVVQFIGFDFRTVSIILELMPRGALSSYISKCKHNMDWSTRYQMMLDICEGMTFLHSTTCADGSEKKELFHQDLKSANVLLLEEEGILRAKIGDFGLSRISSII